MEQHDGPASKEEIQQYCSQLLGLTEPDLLNLALDEILGSDASVGFHAIDQMKDLISEAYQKHEVKRIAENLSKLSIAEESKESESSKPIVNQDAEISEADTVAS